MRKRKYTILFGCITLVALSLIAPGLLAAQTGKKAVVKPAIARPLPNLTLNTTEGMKWSLHEQRGRLILLNFWATWCAPCRKEVPYLVSLSSKYKERGLDVVGIAIDSENSEQIQQFITEFKVDYPMLLTVPGSLLSQQKAVPMTMLIDEKGVLVKKYVGAVPESLFEKDILNLLAKQSMRKNSKARRPVF